MLHDLSRPCSRIVRPSRPRQSTTPQITSTSSYILVKFPGYSFVTASVLSSARRIDRIILIINIYLSLKKKYKKKNCLFYGGVNSPKSAVRTKRRRIAREEGRGVLQQRQSARAQVCYYARPVVYGGNLVRAWSGRGFVQERPPGGWGPKRKPTNESKDTWALLGLTLEVIGLCLN